MSVTLALMNGKFIHQIRELLKPLLFQVKKIAEVGTLHEIDKLCDEKTIRID